MPKQNLNLQDGFLNRVRRDGGRVTVFLLDGTKLEGVVTGFDNFTVILDGKEEQHLIYKHAICTIICPRSLGTNNSFARKAVIPERGELEALADKFSGNKMGPKIEGGNSV